MTGKIWRIFGGLRLKSVIFVTIFTIVGFVVLNLVGLNTKWDLSFLGARPSFGQAPCDWADRTWFGCHKDHFDETFTLNCPAGRFPTMVEVIKDRRNDGDRDCYNFKFYCCQY
ncbi:MAG: hypothetical protein V1674_06560 [Candidatus Omnitrophota bacterium]